MKFSLRVGSILAALTLSTLGCDPEEPASEPSEHKEETSTSKQGPESPPAPVVPAANVVLPAPGTMTNLSPDGAKPVEKKLEEKPATNQGERRPENYRNN